MDHRKFLKHFLPSEPVLKAFLRAAVRDLHELEDVLQEISSVLWEKFQSFDETRPFLPWALGVARLEVLKWRQQHARSRETVSDEALALLAEAAAPLAPEVEARSLHLAGCLEWLKGAARRVVEMRYGLALPIAEVARELRKSVPATEMILVRARRVLQECLEHKAEARQA